MEITDQFYNLGPEEVLTAVESLGFIVTGRCTPLNSYENRVYEVELDPDSVTPATDPIISISPKSVVVKFYRPGRWTKEQILEEHQFMQEIREVEVPAVTPIIDKSGETLHVCAKTRIFFTVFPKAGGRAPDELDDDQFEQLGRLMARLHNVGAAKPFKNRITINSDTYLKTPLEFLLKGGFIMPQFVKRYEDVVHALQNQAADKLKNLKNIRTHGDCHMGNLLWNNSQKVAAKASGVAYFLDFDDAAMAPAVQDLWMLLSKKTTATDADWETLIESYEQIRPFDFKEIASAELLRAMRIVHFSGWIARRWTDPSFPRVFTQFGTEKYWEEELRQLMDIVESANR